MNRTEEFKEIKSKIVELEDYIKRYESVVIERNNNLNVLKLQFMNIYLKQKDDSLRLEPLEAKIKEDEHIIENECVKLEKIKQELEELEGKYSYPDYVECKYCSLNVILAEYGSLENYHSYQYAQEEDGDYFPSCPIDIILLITDDKDRFTRADRYSKQFIEYVHCPNCRGLGKVYFPSKKSEMKVYYLIKKFSIEEKKPFITMPIGIYDKTIDDESILNKLCEKLSKDENRLYLFREWNINDVNYIGVDNGCTYGEYVLMKAKVDIFNY